MADPVLVLRPEPGAARTADSLRRQGFQPIVYPLFAVEPVDWTPPDVAGFDAVLVTSANALRLAGPALAAYRGLPLYAVGEATATRARDMGFASVRQGGGDSASTIPLIARDGHKRVFHPCGVEIRPFDPRGLSVTHAPVYRASPIGDAEGLGRALPRDRGAFAFIHSPRAGARFAELMTQDQRARITIIAISAAASEACGTGWHDRVAAGAPTGAAMLAGLQMLV